MKEKANQKSGVSSSDSFDFAAKMAEVDRAKGDNRAELSRALVEDSKNFGEYIMRKRTTSGRIKKAG